MEPINYGTPWVMDRVPSEPMESPALIATVIEQSDSFTVVLDNPAAKLGQRFCLRDVRSMPGLNIDRQVAVVEVAAVRSDHCICQTFWKSFDGKLETLDGRGIVAGQTMAVSYEG